MGTRTGELVNALRDCVFAEVSQVGTEGIGLDAVHAHREVGVVHRSHHVGARDIEDLVAAFVALEIFQGEIVRLQHRAHRAIRHNDPFGHGLQKRRISGLHPLSIGDTYVSGNCGNLHGGLGSKSG